MKVIEICIDNNYLIKQEKQFVSPKYCMLLVSKQNIIINFQFNNENIPILEIVWPYIKLFLFLDKKIV